MRRKFAFSFIIVSSIFYTVYGLRCKKNFFYHQHYGYGYNIFCQKLDSQSARELKTTMVYNEIKLTIVASNLTANDWNLFGTLEKLREINIINSSLRYNNEPLFNQLTNLNYLVIENSNFNVIFNNTFKALSNLIELSLNNNSLMYIPISSFNNLVHLNCLHLSKNYFESLLDIPICEALNLKKLYLQNNHFKQLPHNVTCLSHLEELYLDYNIIESFGQSPLVLPNLKVLSVSYNKIHNLDDLLCNLNAVTYLNFEGNRLITLNDTNFENLTYLEGLNLKNNLIKSMSSNVFSSNKRLLQMNFQQNGIFEINLNSLSIFESLTMAENRVQSLQQFSYLVGLKFLDLAHNHIGEIQGNVFQNLTSLRYLNLSFNSIGNNLLRDSLLGLHQLLVLNLNNNNISDFNGRMFAPCKKLEILDLSGNRIARLNNESFANLFSLKTLNISHNHLKYLRHDVLRHQMFLKILDVAGNFLQSIEYSLIISELPSLRAINVRENFLTCEFLVKMIDYLKSNEISYTIYEEFKYDKENVAGIYCQETENKLKQTLDSGNVLLENNTEMLRTLFNLTAINKKQYEEKLNQTIVYVLVFVSLAFGILVVAYYRLHLYRNRRSYSNEDLELIHRG